MMVEKVDSERLMAAIGRDGSALSSSQENHITRWIEANTSDDVVPRDHRGRCAVHFVAADAKAELRNELSDAEFDYERWDIARDTWEVAGSGEIVKKV